MFLIEEKKTQKRYEKIEQIEAKEQENDMNGKIKNKKNLKEH